MLKFIAFPGTLSNRKVIWLDGKAVGFRFHPQVNLIHQFPLKVVKRFSMQSLTDSICESLFLLHEKVDSFIFPPKEVFCGAPSLLQ